MAGVLSLILAYGLWNGRSWAWTWTLIFSIGALIISIIGIAVGIGIIGIVIYAVVIYYLTRARVKALFGKGAPLVQAPPAVEPTLSRPPEIGSSFRLKIPRWKNGKYKIVGLVILALLIGTLLGYSIEGSSPQPSQQATVYLTQYGYVTQPSYVYVTESRYVSVTQTIGQGVTIYVTQTVTRTVPIATTTPITGGPYVVIRYSARTADSIGGLKPAPGNIFLVVTMTIENHGYERVYVFTSDFYVIVGNRQFKYSSATYSLDDYLPSTELFNGLTLTGSIAYEVPINYGTYSLLWGVSPGRYNIQYIQSG